MPLLMLCLADQLQLRRPRKRFVVQPPAPAAVYCRCNGSADTNRSVVLHHVLLFSVLNLQLRASAPSCRGEVGVLEITNVKHNNCIMDVYLSPPRYSMEVVDSILVVGRAKRNDKEDHNSSLYYFFGKKRDINR